MSGRPRVHARVRNETLFREVNERILGINHSSGDGAILQILCECGEDACIETITLSVSEYEMVRAHPARFLVRPGHEDPEVEAVVGESQGTLIVEKIGDAAAEAARLDPRARPAEASVEL